MLIIPSSFYISRIGLEIEFGIHRQGPKPFDWVFGFGAGLWAVAFGLGGALDTRVQGLKFRVWGSWVFSLGFRVCCHTAPQQ